MRGTAQEVVATASMSDPSDPEAAEEAKRLTNVFLARSQEEARRKEKEDEGRRNEEELKRRREEWQWEGE